jgi:hypothetical protein
VEPRFGGGLPPPVGAGPATPPITLPCASICRNCGGASRPLCAALDVIASFNGRRETTALKLPLVPITQPRS